VDWHVPHGHEHRDLSKTIMELGRRRARPGEVMIEAGCWKGGSTAKWSHACRMLGYRLHVYDSFEGVEAMTEMERGGYDYTGEYVGKLEEVRANVARYGDLDLVEFHPGWFCDSMKPGTVPGPVRLVYIDCDLAKGTVEVLEGVMPVLSEDGVVVSEDCQVKSVAQLLAEPETWQRVGARLNGARFSRHLGIFHPKER
jgi:O-methyltransferase